MGCLVELLTLPWRVVRGAIEGFRLWKRLQADADARICLGFKRQQEILSERVREAGARGDAADEERARQQLRRVQDNELSYHEFRIAHLAAEVVAERAPSGVIGPDVPELPEPERAVLERAATALVALRPGQTAPEHFRRGNAFYAAGDFQRALREYEAALRLEPDHAVTLNNRGAALFQLKRYELALAQFSRSLEFQPDDPATLNNRAGALFHLKRYEEALADCNRSLELRPDAPATLNNRGIALLRGRRHEEALTDFNRALDRQPGDSGTLYNRACCFSVMGRYEQALRDLGAAIARHGQHRRMAREDEDFEGLRNDPQWGPKFWEIVGTED